MEFNYINGLLLSDLLCLYKIQNEKKYFDEIFKRLSFCDFTKEEIEQFIRFEGEIIDSRTEKYNKPIINKYWFIGKKNKIRIFDNVEEYMYNPMSDNSKVLLLSETLAIIDEAIFLSFSNEINNYKSKKEILSLSKENVTNWLFVEFKSRFEYICRCANHNFEKTQISLYFEKIKHVYDNEIQILLFRWPKEFYNDVNMFVPYTNQYYD